MISKLKSLTWGVGKSGLQLGLITELRRKSLPAIAKAVGLDDNQALHHFVANSPWKVAEFRQQRLTLIKKLLNGRPFTSCIDETGDKKKGKTTDYVARHISGTLESLRTAWFPLMPMVLLTTSPFRYLTTVQKVRAKQ